MSKKVLFVSHCIFNRAIKPESRRSSHGAVKEIVDVFASSDVAVVQLPCPHVKYGKVDAFNRKPKSKEQHDTKPFRAFCKKFACEILDDIKQYHISKYKILGILGIELSPTCAVYRVQDKSKINPGRGILFEELEAEMQKRRIQVPIIGVDLNNIYNSSEKIKSLIENA